MNASETVHGLYVELMTQRHGKRFIHFGEFAEMISGLPLGGFIPTPDQLMTIYGLPTIPTAGGYYMFLSCDYCHSHKIPHRGYCPDCGAPL